MLKRNSFSRSTEDLVFMSQYYNDVTSLRRFKQVLKKGLTNSGPNHQEFETELFKSWNDYLVDVGRATPSAQKIADKWGIAAEVFNVLQDDKDIEFRIIDPDKRIGAIRFDGVFYEVSVTRHKKPLVDPGQVVIAKKLHDYISRLADAMSEQYQIVMIKNNQVTIEDNEGTQTSVKIVRKKVNLF